MARSRLEDGPESRPRRNKLPRFRAVARTQGADHGRRFGMGRGAAIAYAREGADVAINYSHPKSRTHNRSSR